MQKRIELQGSEVKALEGFFANLAAAQRDLAVAAGMVLARSGIMSATVESMVDNALLVTLPDESAIAETVPQPT